jgi:hypothetical protein
VRVLTDHKPYRVGGLLHREEVPFLPPSVARPTYVLGMADPKVPGYTFGLVLAAAGVVAIVLGLTIDADGTRGGVLGLGGGVLGMGVFTVVRAALRK